MKDAAPFLVDSTSQFRTAGPYPLDSAAYAADYNEVKELGSVNSTSRTPLETHLAAFWQTNPGPNYNLLAQRFVGEKSLDTTDSARLFAMIDLNAADAIITAWSDKYARLFCRPMATIQHGEDDGNPATVGDPTWTPLFNPSLPVVGGVGPALTTPPYPEHPSGAVSYASSTMHAFQSFFGTDDETFYVTSSRFPGEQLPFDRFSALINQIRRSADLGRDPFPERRRSGGKSRSRGRGLDPRALLRIRPLTVQRGSGPAAAPTRRRIAPSASETRASQFPHFATR